MDQTYSQGYRDIRTVDYYRNYELKTVILIIVHYIGLSELTINRLIITLIRREVCQKVVISKYLTDKYGKRQVKDDPKTGKELLKTLKESIRSLITRQPINTLLEGQMLSK